MIAMAPWFFYLVRGLWAHLQSASGHGVSPMQSSFPANGFLLFVGPSSQAAFFGQRSVRRGLGLLGFPACRATGGQMPNLRKRAIPRSNPPGNFYVSDWIFAAATAGCARRQAWLMDNFVPLWYHNTSKETKEAVDMTLGQRLCQLRGGRDFLRTLWRSGWVSPGSR